MAHGRQPKPKPLYQNVMDDILTAIDSGGFSFDKPICTESGLMDKYGYSRITVRRALDELENMGVLYRKRGVGSFVSRDSYLSSKEDSVSVAGKLFAFIWPFNISRTSLALTFQSANDYLLAHGCFGSVFITEDEGEKKSSMVLSRLAHTDVAGIAYYPLKNDIHIDLLNPFVFKNRPVVIMDMPSGCSYLPSVTSDNAGGSLKLMEHLTMLGHRKIAYISGIGAMQRATVGDRIAGYLAGHSRAGLPITPDFIHTDVTADKWTAPLSEPDSMRALLEHLVSCGVTAVLAENDALAYHIIVACRDLGIDVPGRLSVCGFDDSEWAALLEHSEPSAHLTTVRQDQAAMGRAVAELLYKGLNEPIGIHKPVVVPTTLITGDTTAKVYQPE